MTALSRFWIRLARVPASIPEISLSKEVRDSKASYYNHESLSEVLSGRRRAALAVAILQMRIPAGRETYRLIFTVRYESHDDRVAHFSSCKRDPQISSTKFPAPIKKCRFKQ
jgi:hypothetical protein